MARSLYKLSAKAVEKAKHSGKKTKGGKLVPECVGDGGGLYLQLAPSQTKSWIFRFTLAGRAREMGLGSCRDVSLAEARNRAAGVRRQVADGVDPVQARKDARAEQQLEMASALTFDDCAKKYIEANRAGWRSTKHAAQWASTIKKHASGLIGSVAVRDVDTELVLRVLRPIWTTRPETASRLRGRIERILDSARVEGYRTGDNPARWRGHLQHSLANGQNRKVRRHHAALAFDDLPAFLRELRKQEGTAARALEFLILNVSRTNEVLGAAPGEVDTAKSVWTVPGARMKSGREHRVPLAPRSIEIVEQRPKAPYLFEGQNEGRPLSNMAMLELLKRMGRDDVTVHGFRSTFRDWAAECTSYPNEVCEMALAHAIGNRVEAAYRRGDLFEKRRQLMTDWARFCDGGAKVVPIAKAAA